jgi:S1-C subfamily serine protease
MYESPTDDAVFTYESEPPAGERSTFGRVVGSVVVAGALFLSGLGIGWLVTSEPESPGSLSALEATTTSSIPTTTTLESTATTTAEEPPISVVPSETELAPVPELPEGSEEPVADIAELVLPSIVQIEIGTLTGEQGVGSGVIYDTNGKILTAAHVVEGADSVTVLLSDGSRQAGVVLGSDTVNDIAVIQLDRTGLPAAALALDQEIRVGQLAVAVGSPWGLDSTVTAGIVSAVGRPVLASDGGAVGMIQTDAAINPGNSGGALVDRGGRVIGINVSIFTESGANDGVGFAVPITRAFAVAEAIAAGEEFVPGFLGITGDDAPVGETPGAVVASLQPTQAAAEAGIEAGDVIIAVNDRQVLSLEDLAAMVRDYRAGTVVTLTILRGGDQLDIEVALGAR